MEKEEYKLIKIKIPKGYFPEIFEMVGDKLYIWCKKGNKKISVIKTNTPPLEETK